MDFTISLAEKNIRIISLFDEVYYLCSDYLSEHEPDMLVTIKPENIAYERLKNAQESEIEGIPVIDYSDSYLETLAVYRKIAAKMLAFDTMLMHGAVVAVKDKAWLFTAPSGTGKTTHIRLWLDNIPGSFVVNGDKPLIRVGEEIIAYGTPWAGKEGMHQNIGIRLCGIVFLERGETNCIDKIPFSAALPEMVQQSFRPEDKKSLEQTLRLIGVLGKRVPLYRLRCNMLSEAALIAYNTLSETEHE